MFSYSDVFGLFACYSSGYTHVKKDAFIIMVAKACLTCAEIKTYAIKIDDFTELRAKINAELINYPGDLKDKIAVADELFAEKFNAGLSNTTYEKIFLEYFSNHKISLYEAYDDYSNWSKLTLSNSPLQPVQKPPCD